MDEHEKQIALMEAEMAAAEDAFFLARPQTDTLDRRNVFRAGFKRAWDLMVKWAAEAEAANASNEGPALATVPLD